MIETFRFECQRCGGCCKNPGQMTPADLARIADGLRISREKFYLEYCETFPNLVGLKPKTGQNGVCIFFGRSQGEGYCEIHDFSPSTCRQQPIKPGRDLKFLIINNCPGVGKGPERSIAEWAEETKIEESVRFMWEYALKALQLARSNPNILKEYIGFIKGGKRELPSEELRKFSNEVLIDVYEIRG